ncbi:SAM complex subunit [Martiniozyma asiatica (nom. inval.)]|nr:SAM complex subunit [Martiniozyma asiatica]
MSDRQQQEFNESFMESFSNSKDEVKLTPLEEAANESQQIILQYNQRTFQEMIKWNKDRPAQSVSVSLIGAGNHFRDNFLQRQIKPLLENEHLTLEKYLKNIDITTQNFMKTNAITNSAVLLGLSPYKVTNTPMDTLEIVTQLQIQPVKKFFMKVGTNVGNGEGDGYVSLQWKNAFGGGEMFNLDTNLASNEVGKSNRSQYVLSYSMPFFNSPNYRFDTVLYHSSRLIDYTTYHDQLIKGITLKLLTTHLPFERKVNHEISIENLLRTISIAQPSINYRNNSIVNDYFLLNAGSQFKSSISHSMFYDSRDNNILPTSGGHLRQTTELSILPGSQFYKLSLDASKAFAALNKDIITTLSFRSGFVRSFGESNSIHPMDKFNLGGPNDVRGFLTSGLGPKQMGLSLGGDIYYAFGASVFTRIPFTPKDTGFKSHFFINGGKLTDASSGMGKLSRLSVSCGAGLIYAHPMARFELNWCLPLVMTRGDQVRKGLQWGIGVSFM